MNKFTTLLFSSLIFLSCTSYQEKESSTVLEQKKDYALRHATNFTVRHDGSHKIVEVLHPFPGAAQSLKYRLIPKEEKSNASYKEQVIFTPVERFVCTSTTHIAPLVMLNVQDKLVGFPSTQYISSEKVRQQVDEGKTIELGKDSDLNTELLLDLSPDLVMGYSMTGDYTKLSLLEQSGTPVIMNAEFLEETPLGRAEWIKFMALLFNKEKEADSIFTEIETNYNHVKHEAASSSAMHTVMSGIVYGDTWYVPGGQSWAAKFFRDAATMYMWQTDSATGSLELSFEAVYEKAQQADLWIGAANFMSLEELRNAEPRYSQFSSFKSGEVYTYNARVIENGGNDYFESGYSRPDLILSDLVKIAHPELLQNHGLYYFRKLDK